MTTAEPVEPQPLPDLSACRAQMLREGAPDVVPLVHFSGSGLLAELPTPPPDSARVWPWNGETPPAPKGEAEQWPEIFVAMPSFKQGKFIEAALRSVLLQNYPRLRLVVCDAASPDETSSVIARYRPWISHVRCARDRGQSDALNLAFSLAPSSGLLCWLNSDDLFLPGAFHAVARAWMRTRADFIYGDGLTLDEATGRLFHDLAGVPHPHFRRYPGAIFSHAAFWSASLAQPFRADLHGALDYEYWVRLLPRTRHRHHIAQPLGVIRVHPDAKSHDPALAARWIADSKINGAVHPELYQPDPFRKRFHRLVSRVVVAARRARATQAAREICAQAAWALTPRT